VSVGHRETVGRNQEPRALSLLTVAGMTRNGEHRRADAADDADHGLRIGIEQFGVAPLGGLAPAGRFRRLLAADVFKAEAGNWIAEDNAPMGKVD
jgi:hypothetical protein